MISKLVNIHSNARLQLGTGLEHTCVFSEYKYTGIEPAVHLKS